MTRTRSSASRITSGYLWLFGALLALLCVLAAYTLTQLYRAFHILGNGWQISLSREAAVAKRNLSEYVRQRIADARDPQAQQSLEGYYRTGASSTALGESKDERLDSLTEDLNRLKNASTRYGSLVYVHIAYLDKEQNRIVAQTSAPAGTIAWTSLPVRGSSYGKDDEVSFPCLFSQGHCRVFACRTVAVEGKPKGTL